MKIFVGLGLTYGSSPDDELTGVASAPAIAHTGGNEWLIGHTNPSGNGIAIRPYTAATPTGFGNPLNLTASATRNDFVAGRPAIAYFNGRLVLVWGRVADNRAFRFVAADYQPGNTTISVVQAGDIPGVPGGYVTEFQTSPTLAHDGVGTFYLAVVRRSGLTGLTHDAVFVYSSPNGRTWTRLSGSYPGNSTFHTGQTHTSIAAKPNGDVLLAIVSGPNNPGRMLRFRNGAWTELGSSVFQLPPDYNSDISLVRSSTLN